MHLLATLTLEIFIALTPIHTPPPEQVLVNIKPHYEQMAEYKAVERIEKLDVDTLPTLKQKPVKTAVKTPTRQSTRSNNVINQTNTFIPGYCTWFIKNQAPWVNNSWSHARFWASRAAADGHLVNNTPRVGSVGQTTRGHYGHVVLITGVEGDTITITEMNRRNLFEVTSRTAQVSEFVYIHPK